MSHWVAIFNGFDIGKDGQVPYFRRHSEPTPYQQYPYGVLVMVQAQQHDGELDKFAPRLVPHILVEVMMGPSGNWAKSYGTLHLQLMLGTKRPSVVSIRRTCDIQFPTTISYPLRQRLTLHCALADATLPRPQTLPNADHWELADDGLDDGINCTEAFPRRARDYCRIYCSATGRGRWDYR